MTPSGASTAIAANPAPAITLAGRSEVEVIGFLPQHESYVVRYSVR